MSNTKPVGRALLFEHLPFVRYRQSAQGVLLVVFANGDAFFYPLNEQTKGDTVSGNKMPLTKDVPSKKKSGTANLEQYNPNKSAQSTSETANNTKPFAFDITLSLSPELYRVFSFNFGVEDSTDNARVPRKVLLSPDKQLLMIIGVLYRGKSSLVVYKILEEGPNFFHVVYHDLSLTFLDACFSPDSNSLVAILAKFPTLIFISTLPAQEPSSLPPQPPNLTANGQPKPSPNGNHAVSDPAFTPASSAAPSPTPTPTSFKSLPQQNVTTSTSQSQSSAYVPPLPPWAKRFISTEPRKLGPILVLGPAVGSLGQPLKMTHISNNSFHPYPHLPPSFSSNSAASIPHDHTHPCPPAFQYVTWNDDGLGEYCLWTVTKAQKKGAELAKGGGEVGKGGAAFIYHQRQLVSTVSSDDDTPASLRCYILSMAFAPAHPHRLLAVLRRYGHPRPGANGFGMHMIDTAVFGTNTSTGGGPGGGGGGKEREVWYQVCGDTMDASDMVCCKWSDTMLLGSAPSAAVVMKGKGLYELVDHHCASAFQVLHEEFVNTISNFVQVGRYHRYWLNWTGKLRVIIVTPQNEAPHPEWAELFNHSHDPKRFLLEMRILGSRVGYFVNDLRVDPQANLSDLPKKKSTTASTHSSLPPSPSPTSGPADVLMGMHLYRCFQCKQTLLRPLVCGRCMGAAYCSKKCQLLHLEAHKIDCIVPHLPAPHAPLSSASPSSSLPPSTFQPPYIQQATASLQRNPPTPSPPFPMGFAPPYGVFPTPAPFVPPSSSSTPLSTSSMPHPTTHPPHSHAHTHTCAHPSHSHAPPSSSSPSSSASHVPTSISSHK